MGILEPTWGFDSAAVLDDHSDTMPETTLSTVEAARELGVSVRRILDLLNEDRFPHAYKRGREWRIPVEDVENFQRQPHGRPKKRRGRPRK